MKLCTHFPPTVVAWTRMVSTPSCASCSFFEYDSFEEFSGPDVFLGREGRILFLVVQSIGGSDPAAVSNTLNPCVPTQTRLRVHTNRSTAPEGVYMKAHLIRRGFKGVKTRPHSTLFVDLRRGWHAPPRGGGAVVVIGPWHAAGGS